MRAPTVPAIALLPLRLFFGATFLWAGLDKLLDPTFLDPAAATSLHAQLEAFARASPLADLIRTSLPLATPIGVLIALGELGIGLGAITGLAFRVAAAGGFVLSLLFWLTASWATHPYYFGADLPYAAGWLTLAVAGHGGLWVPSKLRIDRPAPSAAEPTRRPRPDGRTRRVAGHGPAPIAWSPERRLLLQTGALAAVSAIVASLTVPLRAVGIVSEAVRPTSSPLPTGASTPAASPAVSPGASPAQAAGHLRIASVADVQAAGWAPFTVPFDAPAPLPAGDPGLVVELGDHTLVAFDAVCTHAGCTVEFDRVDSVIFCPCHGAEFDPVHDGAVIDGPTRTPLTKLPLVIDPVTGTISLMG